MRLSLIADEERRKRQYVYYFVCEVSDDPHWFLDRGPNREDPSKPSDHEHAMATSIPCEHGRPGGYLCPHCLGVT